MTPSERKANLLAKLRASQDEPQFHDEYVHAERTTGTWRYTIRCCCTLGYVGLRVQLGLPDDPTAHVHGAIVELEKVLNDDTEECTYPSLETYVENGLDKLELPPKLLTLIAELNDGHGQDVPPQTIRQIADYLQGLDDKWFDQDTYKTQWFEDIDWPVYGRLHHKATT